MKLFLITIFSLIILNAKSYTAVAEYTADSKKSACDRALSYAKNDAMAQAGTFVSSEFSMDFKDSNGDIDSKKSRELKQYSVGFTKLLNKKSEVLINDKTFQFTCKVTASFDIDVDKIKQKLNKEPSRQLQTTKNIDLEFYKLQKKVDKLQEEIKKINKELSQKQTDTKKIAILHGMVGLDSYYGMLSGVRLTFGLVLNKNIILKFGSGAQKALVSQNFNTFEILDFSLSDNNSVYSNYYGVLGAEYYAFRYKDYFLCIDGGLKLSDSEQLRVNKDVNLTSTPTEISGSLGVYLGFSYYKFGLVFIPSNNINYIKNNQSQIHKSSSLEFGLSLAIPIDIY